MYECQKMTIWEFSTLSHGEFSPKLKIQNLKKMAKIAVLYIVKLPNWFLLKILVSQSENCKLACQTKHYFTCFNNIWLFCENHVEYLSWQLSYVLISCHGYKGLITEQMKRSLNLRSNKLQLNRKKNIEAVSNSLYNYIKP